MSTARINLIASCFNFILSAGWALAGANGWTDPVAAGFLVAITALAALLCALISIGASIADLLTLNRREGP